MRYIVIGNYECGKNWYEEIIVARIRKGYKSGWEHLISCDGDMLMFGEGKVYTGALQLRM